MILLSFEGRLSARSEKPAPEFLGGVLHGLLGELLGRHTHGVFEKLSDGDNRHYAILAPPPLSCSERLVFGVALYSRVESFWPEVAEALERARSVHAGSWRADVHDAKVRQLPVPGFSASCAPVGRTTVGGLTVDLVTPLKLITSTKRLHGRLHDTPTLSSLVGSVSRRIRTLEPDWIAGLQLDSEEWREVVSAIGEATLVRSETRWTGSWYFRDRLSKPVPLRGLVGRLQWTGSFPGSAVRVLDAGQWVGAGQGTALGQGFFRVASQEKSACE